MSEKQQWRIRTEGPGDPLPDGQIPGPGTAQTPRSKSSPGDNEDGLDSDQAGNEVDDPASPPTAKATEATSPSRDQPIDAAIPPRAFDAERLKRSLGSEERKRPIQQRPTAAPAFQDTQSPDPSTLPRSERSGRRRPPGHSSIRPSQRPFGDSVRPSLTSERTLSRSQQSGIAQSEVRRPVDREPNHPQAPSIPASEPGQRRWLWATVPVAVVLLIATTFYLLQRSGPEAEVQNANPGATSDSTSNLVGPDPAGATEPNAEASEVVVGAVPAGELYMELADFQFFIRATVDSQATKEALESATLNTYRAYGVADLTVDPAVGSPTWIDFMPAVINQFWTVINGSITITDSETIVTGQVADPQSLEALLQSVGPEFGFPPVRNEVQLVNLEPASIQIVSKDGFVTLSGGLPSEAVRRGIVESAKLLFGQARVSDEFVIDTTIFAPFPLIRFGGNMNAFAPFTDFEIGVDRGVFYGTLIAGLNFEEAENELTPQSKQRLEEFALLFSNSTWPVRITGHTDGLGSPADNQQLSEKRAETVAAFFTDQGISPDRLQIVGKGESEPIADNATEDGRAKNRRVVFEIGRQVAEDQTG